VPQDTLKQLPICALQTKIRSDVDALKCCILDRGALFATTLGATKMLKLFVGNWDWGSSLQAVVHATGGELGVFGWTR
jgi:hypothetical protein